MSTAVGKGAGLPPVVGQKKVGLEQLGEDISPSTISIDSDDQLTNFDDDPFFSSLFSDLDTHSEDNETTSDASTSEGEDIVLRNLPSPPIDLDGGGGSDFYLSSSDDDDIDAFATNFSAPPSSMYRNHSLELPPEEATKTTVDIFFAPPYEGQRFQNSTNPQDDGVVKEATGGGNKGGGRKQNRAKGKAGKGNDAFAAPTPTIEETLEFFKNLEGTWQPSQDQLRVFCDYIRAAAISAKQNRKRLKKGDTIHRALALSFGEALYQRGGGVKEGSASDSLSKLFHYITGSARVKRKRKRAAHEARMKAECGEATPPKKRLLRKLLPRRPMIPMILPGGHTIPPALIFMAAPILFVCFLAYGHSSPAYNEPGMVGRSGSGSGALPTTAHVLPDRSLAMVGPPRRAKAFHPGSGSSDLAPRMHGDGSGSGAVPVAHAKFGRPATLVKEPRKGLRKPRKPRGKPSQQPKRKKSGHGGGRPVSLIKEPKKHLRHRKRPGRGHGNVGRGPAGSEAKGTLPAMIFASSTGLGGGGQTGGSGATGG